MDRSAANRSRKAPPPSRVTRTLPGLSGPNTLLAMSRCSWLLAKAGARRAKARWNWTGAAALGSAATVSFMAPRPCSPTVMSTASGRKATYMGCSPNSSRAFASNLPWASIR